MKVIGLTGGIASGKSTVARFLKELGAVVIDADKIGHEVLRSDAEVWQEVVATFGEGILTPAGSISREKLGKIVFGNAEPLLKLNQITHPRIAERVKTQLEGHRKDGVGVVVVEAPLLLEAGWASLVDEVWVTVASEAAVLRRLKDRAGLSEAESLERIRSQMSVAERIRRADVVIDTDCDLDELKARVAELWRKLDSRQG
jgi:dephospho-CoA kinase